MFKCWIVLKSVLGSWTVTCTFQCCPWTGSIKTSHQHFQFYRVWLSLEILHFSILFGQNSISQSHNPIVMDLPYTSQRGSSIIYQAWSSNNNRQKINSLNFKRNTVIANFGQNSFHQSHYWLPCCCGTSVLGTAFCERYPSFSFFVIYLSVVRKRIITLYTLASLRFHKA
jgi:hypothetical protein